MIDLCKNNLLRNKRKLKVIIPVLLIFTVIFTSISSVTYNTVNAENITDNYNNYEYNYNYNSDYVNENWMNNLSDNLSLKEIAMPGTHDSGTVDIDTILKYFGQTQSTSIDTQLKQGIRFFDIRLDYNKDDFPVYHGIASCNLKFSKVMSYYIDFLEQNPSETILMSVKQENTNDKNFASRLKELYIDNPKYSNYFYTENSIPKLGDVRKKIILLSRFSYDTCSQYGIVAHNWKDNCTFTTTFSDGTNANIQDLYNVPSILPSSQVDKKVDAVRKNINLSKNDNGNSLNINFLSHQASVTPISYYASNIQKKLANDFKSFYTTKNYGIFPLDYYDTEIVDAIISTNYIN